MAFTGSENTAKNDRHIDEVFAPVALNDRFSAPDSSAVGSDPYTLALPELASTILGIDRKLDFALKGIEQVLKGTLHEGIEQVLQGTLHEGQRGLQQTMCQQPLKATQQSTHQQHKAFSEVAPQESSPVDLAESGIEHSLKEYIHQMRRTQATFQECCMKAVAAQGQTIRREFEELSEMIQVRPMALPSLVVEQFGGESLVATRAAKSETTERRLELSIEDMTAKELRDQVKRVAFGLDLYKHSVPFHHDPHDANKNSHNKMRLFCDLETAKIEARRSVLHPDDALESRFKDAGVSQMIAKNGIFQSLTLFIVVLNSIWIAIDVDLNGSISLSKKYIVFQLVEYFFWVFFLFEWVVRFSALRNKFDGVKDAWFVFDGLLVAAASVELIVAWFFDGGKSKNKTSILRLARLAKILKMGRITKVLRRSPQVLILVHAIKLGIPSVVTTFLILGFISYIFAVSLRMMTMDTSIGDTYFTSVPVSLKELLLSVTFPDTKEMIDYLQDEPIAQVLTIVYFSISVVTLLNLLTGVLVNNINGRAEVERETLRTIVAKEQLLEALVQSGLGESLEAKLNRAQFNKFIATPHVVQIFHDIGVDPIGLVEFSAYMFGEESASTAANETLHKISFDRLIDLVMNLGGSNPSTVKDVVDMRRIMLTEVENVEKQLLALHKKFDILECTLGARADGTQHSRFAL